MGERHVAGDRLSAFLDDEMADAEAIAITRHLAGCGACRGELEALRIPRAALRGLPDLHAPILTGSVVAHARRAQRMARRVRLGLTVTIVPLAVALAAYVLGAEFGGVAPTTDVFLVEHVARTAGGLVPVPFGAGG